MAASPELGLVRLPMFLPQPAPPRQMLDLTATVSDTPHCAKGPISAPATPSTYLPLEVALCFTYFFIYIYKKRESGGSAVG